MGSPTKKFASPSSEDFAALAHCPYLQNRSELYPMTMFIVSTSKEHLAAVVHVLRKKIARNTRGRYKGVVRRFELDVRPPSHLSA